MVREICKADFVEAVKLLLHRNNVLLAGLGFESEYPRLGVWLPVFVRRNVEATYVIELKSDLFRAVPYKLPGVSTRFY